MAGQGIPAGARDIKARMGMDEILMAVLDLRVWVFNLLWLMFREVDKTSGTGRANTILFKGNL